MSSFFSACAAPEEASLTRPEMSSSGSPMMAMMAPSGTVSPAGTSILRSTPVASACASIVALSVSISASGSPTPTLSPSFFSQRESCPSSIVGDSFGITTCVAIRVLSQLIQIRDLAHGLDDALDVGEREPFEVLGVGHRGVGAREAFDGGVEIVEGALV